MANRTDFLTRVLACHRNRRGAVQALAAASGGLLLLKAGKSAAGPLAFAQEDVDDDRSGRGRGRGDDNSGPGNAEDRGEEEFQAGEIPADSIEVRIVGDDAGDFVPGELTVDLGQSVTFVNVHSDEHTATGSGFDTGIIPDEGGTATVVLDTPGVFPYACQIHPEMTGTISVRGADGVVPQTRTVAQEAPADATTVSIANLAFNPATVTVPTGTTVAWTNDDSVPHTVTSVDGAFDSGIFDPGASFAFAFNQPGTFPYVCQLHPQMQGTVVAEGEVVAGASQAEAPAAEATPAPRQAQTTEQSGAAVSIVDFAFEPPQLAVAMGVTVVWANDGLAPHTVTGDFADSGVLDPGSTFSHTFDSEGTFDYVCAIHPDMTGTVHVGAGNAAEAVQSTAVAEDAPGLEGVWLLALAPDDEAELDAQHALVTFHADGTVEADFAASPGAGAPTTLLTSGHGEWVVRDDVCTVVLAALTSDANQRFAGTVTFEGEGQLDADGQILEGTFDFAIVSPDGQAIGQGAGTLRGESIPLDTESVSRQVGKSASRQVWDPTPNWSSNGLSIRGSIVGQHQRRCPTMSCMNVHEPAGGTMVSNAGRGKQR